MPFPPQAGLFTQRLLKGMISFWIPIVLAVLMTGGGRLEAAHADRHVITVSIDGLAAFLLDDPKAPLPTLRRLAREGAVVEGGMRVSNPSVTWPNHTSLVTGVHPERHGVLANGVLVRGGSGAPVVVDPRGAGACGSLGRRRPSLLHDPRRRLATKAS